MVQKLPAPLSITTSVQTSSDLFPLQVSHNLADALSSGSNVERAAALVDLADDGTGLPISLIHSPNFGKLARRYFLYNQFDPLWTLNVILLLVLNFIEVPSWCTDKWPHPCGGKDVDAYHLGDVPYLHPKVFNVVELVSLAVLLAQVRLVYRLLQTLGTLSK